jgi:hypothetical protein
MVQQGLFGDLVCFKELMCKTKDVSCTLYHKNYQDPLIAENEKSAYDIARLLMAGQYCVG